MVASISDNTFAIAFVPFAKFSNSNTPRGPFHITVFAFLSSSVNIFIDSGPMSKPCHPSGISLESTVFISVSFENSFPQTVSTGNNNFTPFSSAFFIVSFAKSILSNSQIESPTLYPIAFKKVYVIPPPIIILSAFSINFSITFILSETFAPPSIATNGLTGLSNASPNIFTSFSIKNPHTAGK